MLTAVNLSLSLACGADCIFCARDRGAKIKEKIMPLGLAKKITSELSSPEFRARHSVTHMQLGENGDAFLNPRFIEIARHIKAECPWIETGVFTNFQNLTEEKSRTILEEGLIDKVHCNIDGANAENYFNVKRIPLENTMRNLEAFLGLRRELKSAVPLRIHVVTLHDYIHSIHGAFGFYPAKMRDARLAEVPDDFAEIKMKMHCLLLAKRLGISRQTAEKARVFALPLNRLLAPRDMVLRSAVFGWAERDAAAHLSADLCGYSCPRLEKMHSVAFIAPDGTWYACCLDSNNELALGNIWERSIDRIYSSEKRKRLIGMLERREFGKIGGPCRTVYCCGALK
ncbi:MAG: radical SAM protein [Candidatus Diapherotrites archaeon]